MTATLPIGAIILTNADIFLCGIKHSGKSTIGALVAKKLRLPWFDADDLILTTLPSDMSVRMFYRIHGKKAFQEKETKALHALLTGQEGRMVVSLGGGACDNKSVMRMANQNGITIYLRLPEEALFGRIVKDGIPPFLEGEDPKEIFHALYLQRDVSYGKQCALVVELSDCQTAVANADLVLGRLEGVCIGPQHIRS